MRRKTRLIKKLHKVYQICGCCQNDLSGFVIWPAIAFNCWNCGHTHQRAKRKPYTMPVDGQELMVFHDGKLGRGEKAVITQVFKASDNKEVAAANRMAADSSYWINWRDSKIFVEVKLLESDETFYAGQDLRGGFYGIDGNYRLDVDGSLQAYIEAGWW